MADDGMYEGVDPEWRDALRAAFAAGAAHMRERLADWLDDEDSELPTKWVAEHIREFPLRTHEHDGRCDAANADGERCAADGIATATIEAQDAKGRTIGVHEMTVCGEHMLATATAAAKGSA